MNSKASGRSALIIAAGLWLCIAGPVSAAEEGDGAATQAKTESAGAPVKLSKFTKKSRQARHVSSHRKSVRLASASAVAEKNISEQKQPAEPVLKDDAASLLPSSVANARAQLADADVSSGSAAALTSDARARLQVMAANQPDQAAAPAANTELVAADQLNDVDRALSASKSDDKAPSATPAMAVAQGPAAAASSDDSAWGQTSFIGKIFIAFGGLLTLASAARMFMA
jgi:fatty acid/phospholipid biosynthesis enzyme